MKPTRWSLEVGEMNAVGGVVTACLPHQLNWSARVAKPKDKAGRRPPALLTLSVPRRSHVVNQLSLHLCRLHIITEPLPLLSDLLVRFEPDSWTI